MIIAGTISKEGRYWCVTLPALDGTTQGKTRKEALLMAADYVESLLEPQRRSKVTARYIGDVIEVECRDDAALMALVLRRQRSAHGISLSQVSKRLGQTSQNAYARFENGSCAPTLAKFVQLMAAVGEPGRFVWRRGA
ncbi:MAG: XRE family transcriptional regulator [Oxalobacteraceae bacterium]|nr:MAG: XRE family transcriptional regulator [Oxalobacteraceae bacterium]